MSEAAPTVVAVTWWEYVHKHADGGTNVAIAAKVGITPSSVGRWGKGSRPDPEQAAAFAKAYNRPVLEAFVAAGFLTPEEAGEVPAAEPSLDELSNRDLLAELTRRTEVEDAVRRQLGEIDYPEDLTETLATLIRQGPKYADEFLTAFFEAMQRQGKIRGEGGTDAGQAEVQKRASVTRLPGPYDEQQEAADKAPDPDEE